MTRPFPERCNCGALDCPKCRPGEWNRPTKDEDRTLPDIKIVPSRHLFVIQIDGLDVGQVGEHFELVSIASWLRLAWPEIEQGVRDKMERERVEPREVLCRECGQPTMHIGDLCFKCGDDDGS